MSLEKNVSNYKRASVASQCSGIQSIEPNQNKQIDTVGFDLIDLQAWVASGFTVKDKKARPSCHPVTFSLKSIKDLQVRVVSGFHF